MIFYAKQGFWTHNERWTKISFWKFLWMWFIGILECDPYVLRIDL